MCKEREQGFKKDLRGLSSEVNVEALEMLEISDRVKQGRVCVSSKISNESVVKLRVIARMRARLAIGIWIWGLVMMTVWVKERLLCLSSVWTYWRNGERRESFKVETISLFGSWIRK